MLRKWLIAAVVAAPVVAAAQGPQAAPIKTTRIAGSVSMLEGVGGNIGVSSGPDGIVIIDDQYAVMSDNIRKALQALGPQPLKFIVNTHWHGDHTGGNEGFGKAGAVIVAHDNVRKRMSTEQFIKAFGLKVPASPAAALPVITFAEAVTFHLNGDEISVTHVEAGHTDGDSIVLFKKANVLHTGDLFTNGTYPFIDVSSGGSIDGVIANVGRLINSVDDDTRIIPGHGPLGDRQALIAYRDMLSTVRGRLKAAIQRGDSLAKIQSDKPTADLDAVWGKGFLKPEQFVAIVHASLLAPPSDN
ncbi:MBL fold metallo-hydrolase [Nevskia sp.]|uniref:MBL fold metallo-hydrolase n=1 Tax=Nevskia sp. TaxID=1929292 RepID=UPI0025FBA297|nr:MBL fold metallo-hydrolase [Nevskia sp.]HET7797015.1 MBL fold metallo-hydrolase [Nevskia sp.]